ncbi:MAG: alpha/beta hydrolase [Terriglobales bacterium]
MRATALLLRIENPTANGFARFEAHLVDESDTVIEGPHGQVSARLYSPRGAANPPGLVILHGIHHLGMDEPRLVRFSRAFASEGIEVLTPALQSLADYRVDEDDVAVTGAAAHALSQKRGTRVGALGLSFAGGLALLAAADPKFSEDVGFVVAIGAHDDLTRVCRYLATGRTPRPDGTIEALPPHEYGMLVLVYSHVDEFFSSADVPHAREVLRLQLWEQPDAAKPQLTRLSPAGRRRMERLLEHRQDVWLPDLLAMISHHGADMDRLSPHGHLSALRVPVFLLHGSDDSVIPASESLWLAREVPAPYLREVLVSPLLTHVEVASKPSLRDQAALIHFVAEILREGERLRPD